MHAETRTTAIKMNDVDVALMTCCSFPIGFLPAASITGGIAIEAAVFSSHPRLKFWSNYLTTLYGTGKSPSDPKPRISSPADDRFEYHVPVDDRNTVVSYFPSPS